MNIRFFALMLIALITGCSSEYGPNDIAVSDEGVFVEKGSSSTIDGEVVIEKENSGSLIVVFDNGYPDGDVVMRNADDDVILESSFAPKHEIKSTGRGGGAYINEMLSRAAGQLSPGDYLDLFEEFSVYDGDYLRIKNSKKTQGHYSNGEKNERWKVFCENGQLESDVVYKRLGSGDQSVIKKVGKELSYNCDGDVLLSAERDTEGRLQGEYFEAARSRFGLNENESKKPQVRYQRNYKDGEFDGLQKEYFNDGTLNVEANFKQGKLNGLQKEYFSDGSLKVENNFKLGVKDGVEKTYSTKTNYSTNEVTHGLKELKNYVNGQLNGDFSRYDINQKVVLSGKYSNDKPVDLWTRVSEGGASKTVDDYNLNNFIRDKVHAFKDACFLPKSGNRINWHTRNKRVDLSNCQYYVENKTVDINKKISLDFDDEFKRKGTESSSKWSYLAIIAKPSVYEYVKKHGLKTDVVDNYGRSRLHMCITLYRASTNKQEICSTEQAISYIDDVDINAVSNIGTVLHQLSSKRAFGVTKAKYVEEDLKLMRAIIDAGANVNQLDHSNQSALMYALANSEYKSAEILLDAGAAVDVIDSQGRTTIAHLFIDGRNRWKTKKIDDDGVRVLAKIIALGGDTSLPIKDGKTVVDYSEENNTLFHIQTLKDAQSISEGIGNEWKPKALAKNKPLGKKQPVAQSVESAPITPSKVETGLDTNIANAEVVDSIRSSEGESLIDSELPIEESAQVETLLEPASGLQEADQLDGVTSNGSASNKEDMASENDNSSKAVMLLREQASFLVEQANEHIKSSRLKTPKNNSAASSLEQLKKIDPDNENIEGIEAAIGKKYLALADGKINKGDKRGAQNYLNSANEFIADKAVINGYQQRIDSYVATTSVAANENVKTTQYKKNALNCGPSVRVAGVPLLGQTFTAKDSYPRTKSEILSVAARVVGRTYKNVKQSANQITYEQATSRKPIKFTLTVNTDGNNTELSIKAKTPRGIASLKSAYKKHYCEIVAEL